MNIIDIQSLLFAAGVYTDTIDGVAGRKTRKAVSKILSANRNNLHGNSRLWNNKRKAIAAAQVVLNDAGFEAGLVDGRAGHNTRNALEDWIHFQETGRRLTVSRKKIRKVEARSNGSFQFPRQKDCANFYGKPGKGGIIETRLKRLPFEWKTYLSWAPNQRTKSASFHEKCYDAFGAAHAKQAEVYGHKEIKRLKLDLTGGSYNPRRMRGGRSWSMHAFACAEDIWPDGGGLHQRTPTAIMSREPYNEWFDIYEEFGLVSLGREIDRDWMHVQAARL